MVSISVRASGVFLTGVLAACGPAPETTDRLDIGNDVIISQSTLDPLTAPEGVCFNEEITPAVIEQVTERELVAEAVIGPEGNIIKPAEYVEYSSQAVVSGQEPIYFETPCPTLWTPDFVSSLQRALKARGIYNGDVSGTLDQATHDAIRVYQITHGLNSDVLSTDHARALGLVEVTLPGGPAQSGEPGLPG